MDVMFNEMVRSTIMKLNTNNVFTPTVSIPYYQPFLSRITKRFCSILPNVSVLYYQPFLFRITNHFCSILPNISLPYYQPFLSHTTNHFCPVLPTISVPLLQTVSVQYYQPFLSRITNRFIKCNINFFLSSTAHVYMHKLSIIIISAITFIT